MSIYHMDPDACRAVGSNITSVHNEVTNQIGTLTSAIESLVGSGWIAPSATEFKDTAYVNWRTSMNQLLEQLNSLGTRLEAEVVEWETNAAKLAGGASS